MRSIYDNANLAGFAAAFNTTGFTIVTSASVDTKGYNTAALRVFTSTVGAGIGVGAGASLVAVLQESADGTTWATANDNTGTPIRITQEATTSAVIGSARIEGLLQNRLRYLRVQTTANFGGPATPTRQFTSCAVLELSRAYQNPVNTTASNT